MEHSSQTTQPAPPPNGAAVDLTGQTLGDFHVLRKLGQGGMGQVYLAEQRSLKREVALKLLRADLAASDVSLKRFKQEAESVARATHANIVQVYFIGEWQGQHYMALEYVKGSTLRDFITKKGPPQALPGLSIMCQVAAALVRASELGIIHRDIKPENILVTREGEVKVADFGLSRVLEGQQPAASLTQSGVTMGTPLYMSPEQVEGKLLDPRADIYSFGVTCYHLFAGEPPFRGSSPYEIALQHVRAEPRPLEEVRPDLPPALCEVIRRMMAKDPAQRYQTCRDLLKDLQRLREALNVGSGIIPLATPSSSGLTAAPPTPSAGLPPRPVTRRWWPVLLPLGVLAAAALGAAIGYLRQTDRSPADADEKTLAPRAAVEAASLPERDQTLRALVEQYLNPADRLASNPDTGRQLCLDLTMRYLDTGRLDDAEAMFRRLDAIHDVEQYHLVGRLGIGIVHALRDDWQKSLEAFETVQKGRKKTPPDPERTKLINTVVRSNERLVVRLREAVYRNEVNSKGAITHPGFLRVFARKEPPKPADNKPADNRPSQRDKPVGRLPDNPTQPE